MTVRSTPLSWHHSTAAETYQLFTVNDGFTAMIRAIYVYNGGAGPANVSVVVGSSNGANILPITGALASGNMDTWEGRIVLLPNDGVYWSVNQSGVHIHIAGFTYLGTPTPSSITPSPVTVTTLPGSSATP